MKDIKWQNIILISVLIILAIILFLITKKDNNISTNTNKNIEYEKVNNINEFFTVEGCINRYLDVLSNKEFDNLLKLIDNEYLEKNMINENNILNKLESLEGINTFSAKKIYVQKIDKYNNKYYVYGKLKKEIMDGYDLGIDYYIIIKIDKKHQLYSVTPYDGEIFKEAN